MLQIVIMMIASVFLSLLIIGSIKSKQYQVMVDSLPSSFFKVLYGIGYAILNLNFLGLNKKILPIIRKKTSMIYGEKYAEYYARTSIAKAITFTVILTSIFLPFGIIIGDGSLLFFILLAVLGSAIAWYFFVLSIADEAKKQQDVCLAEFPDMVTKFALLINSGMVLHEAWHTVAYSKSNVLYDLMQNSCDEMENGRSEIDAIYDFGVKTNCVEIRKFTASMIQGVSKGNSELSVFLTEQAQEMLEHKRQNLLQKGEKAASKLLIPIGITFIGIILIIGVGAMQSMSF